MTHFNCLLGSLLFALFLAHFKVDAQYRVTTTLPPRRFALNPYTERRIRLPLTCGPAPYVQHAKVVTTTFNNRSSVEGDQSTYACYDGYIIIGDPTITCDANNMQWTAIPICVVTCGAPPAVRAAKVNTSFLYDQSQVGSTARYTCAIGLTIVSSETIVCQPNGTWSPPPICQYGSLIITACGDPPEIEYGSPATRSYTTTRYTWFDKVTYSCDLGFHPEWPDPTITCNPNGTWPNPPKCLPDASCGGAPFVENGYVLDTTFVANRSQPSSTVRYACLSGYRVNGSATIRCNGDLKWSTPPRCLLINCGPPPEVANAQIFNQTFPVSRIAMDGDRVSYQCLGGYYMPDNRATIVCLFDGFWTPEPRCVPGFGNNTVDSDSKTCGMAPLLSQGSIRNATFDTTLMSNIADKIFYQCRESYTLLGPEIVVCRPDSFTWTVMPQCVK